jgi:hypothetical protein
MARVVRIFVIRPDFSAIFLDLSRLSSYIACAGRSSKKKARIM